MIATGKIAPDFTLPQDGGDNITLSDIRPQAVVLFFYPKDSTKGCTIEAKEFSATIEDFAAVDTFALGISRDTIASHSRFRAKYGLTIPLLSDEDGAVCKDYGVWAEKLNFGKKYMGIVRTTVLIDGTGKITRIWNKVRVAGHVAEVLNAAQSL
ncbi:MAG: peroxiredoxin [Paracoccaceae bacterium]